MANLSLEAAISLPKVVETVDPILKSGKQIP